MREELKKLGDLTEKLIRITKQIDENLHEDRIDKDDKEAFYDKVRPFANHVAIQAEEWKKVAIEWVRDYKPKYVHPLTVQNAYDNITHLSIESFYKDSKTKRLVQMNHAVLYTLEEVNKQCKGN